MKLPTHVIVAPSYWAAGWFARKHKLDPACWIHVVSEEIAFDQMAQANEWGVNYSPIIVTPDTTLADEPAHTEAA